MRRKFFTQRVVRYLNKSPREAVGCPILGNGQGQTGWGPEQPDLVGDIPPTVNACAVGRR